VGSLIVESPNLCIARLERIASPAVIEFDYCRYRHRFNDSTIQRFEDEGFEDERFRISDQ
jgi:hypothetical protein